jgi:flagellar protein FlaG
VGSAAAAPPAPTPTSAQVDPKATLETKEQARALIEASAREVDAFLKASNSELRFLRDEDSGRNYFKVVNPHTGDVIIQVPSEEVLAIARKLKELDAAVGKASGVILDERG